MTAAEEAHRAEEPGRAEDAGSALHGPPDAPAIVFVHGTRLTGSMWVASRPPSPARTGRSRWTCPAHGRAGRPPFTLEGAADDVAAAIRDAAAGGRAVVVGLSLGGYVAMDAGRARPGARARARPVGSDRRAGRPAVRAVPRARLGDGRLDGPRLEALNAWFFRSRYPPAIAEPIIAGGFWSSGGATALRAPSSGSGSSRGWRPTPARR